MDCRLPSITFKSIPAHEIPDFRRLFRSGFGTMVTSSLSALSNISVASAILAYRCDELVGAATVINYGAFRQIGNMLVRKRYRRNGIGSALIQHIAKDGIGVELAANQDIAPFYFRNGFRARQALQLVRRPAVSAAKSAVNVQRFQALSKDDVEVIACIERERYGLLRGAVLREYLRTPGSIGLKFVSGVENRVTYGIRLGPWLGPIVAYSDAELRFLLNSVLCSEDSRMAVTTGQLRRIETMCEELLECLAHVYILDRGISHDYDFNDEINPVVSPFFLG